MNPREHALFERHPLNGTIQLSTGEAPTPYHIVMGCGITRRVSWLITANCSV